MPQTDIHAESMSSMRRLVIITCLSVDIRALDPTAAYFPKTSTYLPVCLPAFLPTRVYGYQTTRTLTVVTVRTSIMPTPGTPEVQAQTFQHILQTPRH